tara:strand:+ start:246 stop:512 length:267 start_codon:yes stop_codon:yes gene_type:complete
MEENKLIAEFMGVETTDGLVFQDNNTHEFHPIKYHTSWDWLMPVLKKINLHLHPDTYGLWRMINVPTEYTIKEVHTQAVEFIKQYNDK